MPFNVDEFLKKYDRPSGPATQSPALDRKEDTKLSIDEDNPLLEDATPITSRQATNVPEARPAAATQATPETAQDQRLKKEQWSDVKRMHTRAREKVWAFGSEKLLAVSELQETVGINTLKARHAVESKLFPEYRARKLEEGKALEPEEGTIKGSPDYYQQELEKNMDTERARFQEDMQTVLRGGGLPAVIALKISEEAWKVAANLLMAKAIPGAGRLTGPGAAWKNTIIHAAKFAGYTYVTTQGSTLEERMAAATRAFLYVGTPAISMGMSTTALAILVDFALNVGVSIVSGAYSNAILQAQEDAQTYGKDWKTMSRAEKTGLIVLSMSAVAVSDLLFSIGTKSSKAVEVRRAFMSDKKNAGILRAAEEAFGDAMSRLDSGETLSEITGKTKAADRADPLGRSVRPDGTRFFAKTEAEHEREVDQMGEEIYATIDKWQARLDAIPKRNTKQIREERARITSKLSSPSKVESEAARLILSDGDGTSPAAAKAVVKPPADVIEGAERDVRPVALDSVRADRYGIDLNQIRIRGQSYEGGTATDILRKIVLTDGNDSQKRLANHLIDKFSDRLDAVSVVHERGLGERTELGWYDTDKMGMNWERIRADQAPAVAIHEVVHAVASGRMQQYLESDASRAAMPEGERNAIAEIVKLYEEVRTASQADPAARTFEQALENPIEFMSYALQGGKFTEYLRTTPSAQTTLWGRFVSAIKAALGLGYKGIAGDVERAFDELMGNQPKPIETPVAPRPRKLPEPIISDAERQRYLESMEYIGSRSPDRIAGLLDQHAERLAETKLSGQTKLYKEAARMVRRLGQEAYGTGLVQAKPGDDVKARTGIIPKPVWDKIQIVLRAAEVNRSNADIEQDRGKGMEGPPKQPAPAAEPPPFGDREAFDAKDRYDAHQNDIRERNHWKKFNIGPLRLSIPNGFEVLGRIETELGEPGIWPLTDRLMRGQQRNSATKVEFLNRLHDVASSPFDITLLPASQEGPMINYFESPDSGSRHPNGPKGKSVPKTADEIVATSVTWGIDKHWIRVADAMRDMRTDTTEEMTKYNRTLRYAVEKARTVSTADGPKGAFTRLQQERLKPLSDLYNKAIKSSDPSVTLEDFWRAVDVFVKSDEANVLLVENYYPHLSPIRGSADDASLADKSIFESWEDTPLTRQSRAGTVSRREHSKVGVDPERNPLEYMWNHINRQSSVYYLRDPILRVWNKVAGTDNTRGESLLGKGETFNGETWLRKWLQGMANLADPPKIHTRIFSKARGNNFKAMVAGGNMVVKNWFQWFFGGPNKWKYLKYMSAKGYTPSHRLFNSAKKNFDDTLRKRFGETTGNRLIKRFNDEVIQSQQLLRNYFQGEGDTRIDIPDGTFALFGAKGSLANIWKAPLWTFWKLTDNKLIDLLNKMPIVGGNGWSEYFSRTDTQNRMNVFLPRMMQMADLLIDKNVGYQKFRKTQGYQLLQPWEERGIAELLANGKKVEAAFEASKILTRVGQYVYDKSSRSLIESDEDARILVQYATWWRGYSMLTARDLRALCGKDWFSENRHSQRLNAVKTLVAMGIHSAVTTTLYNIITGRDPVNEDEKDKWIARAKGLVHLGPYAPGVTGGLQTLATPFVMVGKLFDDDIRFAEKMPSQVLQSFIDLTDATYVGGASAVTHGLMYGAASLSGNDELQKKATDGLIRDAKKATSRGYSYFRQFHIVASRALWTLNLINPDRPGVSREEQIRNQNWLRYAMERALDKKDWLPKDYDPSDVKPYSRSVLRSVQSWLSMSNPPKIEEGGSRAEPSKASKPPGKARPVVL